MSTSFDEHLAKGISLAEAGNHEAAAEVFSHCTELEPSSPEGFFYLGEALTGSGKLPEAVAAYEKGLALAHED